MRFTRLAKQIVAMKLLGIRSTMDIQYQARRCIR
jgi:hypothetical protein